MARSGTSLIVRMLAFFILLAVLIGGGTMLYRAGQAQGYAVGLAASDRGQTAPAPGVNPAVPYAPGPWPGYWGPYYGYGYPHFFPFGPLFGLFFVFLFFFLISGLFRAVFWRRHPMGPGYGHWRGGPGPWMGERPQADAGSEADRPKADEPRQPNE